ncbi:hypothetical protein MHYP_G00268980 [Metynnis hypsauchen]
MEDEEERRQVQRGQTSRPGEQAPPGTRQQVVTRQVQLAVSAASGSSRSRVDENMARAFPGLFKRKATNVKPRKRAVKSRHIQFFLLDKVTERTPKTGEEMVLLQAGMGRRTIDIPEDADHAETIGTALVEVYAPGGYSGYSERYQQNSNFCMWTGRDDGESGENIVHPECTRTWDWRFFHRHQ